MKSKISFIIFCLFIFLQTSHLVLAESEKINAGLLSDIWFSELEIKQDTTIDIIGTFHNTSEKNLQLEVNFLINNEIIDNQEMVVSVGEIKKVKTPWDVEIGDFEVKISIDKVNAVSDTNPDSNDNFEIEPENLQRNEISTNIKIKRKIDLDFIIESTTSTLQSTVENIDRGAGAVNNFLEGLKFQDGEVAGFQFSAEDALDNPANNPENQGENEVADDSGDDVVGGTTTGRVRGSFFTRENESPENVQASEAVTFSFENLKSRPFAVLFNSFISLLQIIVTHWKFFLAFLVFVFFFFYFKNKYGRVE